MTIDKVWVTLNKVKGSGPKCQGSSMYYYGVLAYADDVTILSPTITGLKDMLGVCESFCEEYDLQFNPNKSVCVSFYKSNKLKTMPTVTMCNTVIEWADKVKHLGNHIMYNLSESHEINVKKGDLAGRVNSVIVNLCGMSDEVIMQVFNSQCCHYYGSAAWNLADNNVSQFYTMYNKCVRRLLDLPYKTHTRFLTAFTKRKCIQDQIAARFKQLLASMICNNSPSIRFIVNFCSRTAESIISKNLCHLSNVYGIEKTKLLNTKTISKHLSEEDTCVLQAIHDLRAGNIPCLGYSEARQYAYFLCEN